MDRLVPVLFIILAVAGAVVYHYYYQTSDVTVDGVTWSRVVKQGNATTFEYSDTYTKVVRTVGSSVYETFIVTYTRPAGFSTLSFQLLGQSGFYVYHVDVYYDKGRGFLRVYYEFQNPVVHDGSSTYSGAFFETLYLSRSGSYYCGTRVGFDARSTPLGFSEASSLYESYLSVVYDLWSQVNFAPLMRFTLDGVTYFVSIPPEYYSKIFSDVDLPITGYMVIPSDRTVVFGEGTYAVYPAGTYGVVYWFRVYGNGTTVVTTTLTTSFVR